MEDAPGKPDPSGLFDSIRQLGAGPTCPVLYVGDTVADMYVVKNAAKQEGDRPWMAIGVLPPSCANSPRQPTTPSATSGRGGGAVRVETSHGFNP